MIGPRAQAEFPHVTHVHAVAPALSVVNALIHALTSELTSALFLVSMPVWTALAVTVCRSSMALPCTKSRPLVARFYCTHCYRTHSTWHSPAEQLRRLLAKNGFVGLGLQEQAAVDPKAKQSPSQPPLSTLHGCEGSR